MENGELFVMMVGIQTMPAWSVDLLVLLVLLKLYHRLDLAKALEPSFLDDVNCSGEETSLFECSNQGLGVNNCGHSEDAGVRCLVLEGMFRMSHC